MNGAQRIRNACAAWYVVAGIALIASFALLADAPAMYLFGDEARAAAESSATKHSVGLWILLAAAPGTPFVFLIHLLAAIWETLIGMALPREDRSSPRPLPCPGPPA
jgi:hypothetical protein